jgi:hypothetical protein
LPKSTPLEDAPGWRVREHPRHHSWRAGYVIVPVALIVGLLQLLVSSDGNRGEWPERRPADATAPAATATPAAPAERRRAQSLESTGRSSRPLASGPGPADEAAGVGPTQARVFIHHAAGAGNALPAIQLAAYLQTRGFAVTDIRAVDVEIRAPSVRFFFGPDRPEGRRLVDAIGAFYAKAPGQAPYEVADFSGFLPKPRRGTIEVWLSPPDAGESHST